MDPKILELIRDDPRFAYEAYLFVSDAVNKYCFNPALRIKFLLILLAGLNMSVFHFTIYRNVSKWDNSPSPPVWAKLQAQPAGSRPYFFAQATKGIAPVEAPAATVAAPAEQPAATAQPSVGTTVVAVDDRPELESLSFPKDGLSRQWLEFLSQLGATK